jgi:hypothetical protein
MLKQVHVCYQVVESLLSALAVEKKGGWFCEFFQLKYAVAIFSHIGVKKQKKREVMSYEF